MKNSLILYLPTFLLALVVSYSFTPLIKKIAIMSGFVDNPSDRKIHKTPMPQLGGVAIFLGFISAVLVNVNLNTPLKGILISSLIIVIMGVLDDILNLSPWIKLFVQIVVAVITIYFGVSIQFITNPFGGIIYLGWLSIPVTIFWIVGLMNTINLIDGLDGLAAGISAISAFVLTIISIFSGQYLATIISLAILGSTLGFLRYNFNPAQIFMGDTGSMFLGYILATVTIFGVLKSAITLSLAIPVLILGVPIFDTFMAILRRLRNGQHIWAPDKRHIHHQLLALGMSHKQVVLAIYLASAVLGIIALICSLYSGTNALLFLLGIIVFVWIFLFIFKKRKKQIFSFLHLFI